MNCLSFINSKPYPVIWLISTSRPLGLHIPLHEDTDLPFDLSELRGEINHNKFFVYCFEGLKDWNGNQITKLEIFHNKETYQHYDEIFV